MLLRVFALIFSFLFPANIHTISNENIHQLLQQTKQPLEIVRHFIKESPTISEAGGHYGEDTLKMHFFWPNSTIYSFEPNPSAYKKLKEQTKEHDHIFTFPLALYNYDGVVKFHVQTNYGNEGASSILPASSEYSETEHQHSWWYIDKEIEVPCLTLESWAQKEGIKEIDFMWLDMEGVELYVLKAGARLLKNVKAIYTEVNFQEFRNKMTQYKDLASFLNQHGFEQIFFDGDMTFQGNALFVKKNLLQ